MLTMPSWSRHVLLAAVLALPASSPGPATTGGGVAASAFASDLVGGVVRQAALMATPPEGVVAGVVLVARHDRAPRARPQRADDQQFYEVSATGSNDVPTAALRAYQSAAGTLAASYPSCRLPWTLLAAVGRVESDHGRYGGSVLGSDGVSRPAIIGPRLDGSGAVRAVGDSDDGALDGDPLWDRAVGAMQFLPATWQEVAADGDGDGSADPLDIDDAALGSGRYLCRGGDDVSDPAGMARALYRYNASDYYVALVMSFETGYRTGVFVTPSPPPPAGTAPAADPRRSPAVARPHVTRDGAGAARATPGTKADKPATVPSSQPSDDPAPDPAPDPEPDPEPDPDEPVAPALVDRQGTWSSCSTGGVAGWCLGTQPLDLGDPAALDAPAAADFDRDGTVESSRLEFTGLEGQAVALRAEEVPAGTPGAAPTLRVVSIGGQPLS
ncbi:MAG TPA: lytic transglycosylase domain-containing protein [Marmoricola sp.]|nr:lytic transglycosylase domain-containing protein [Marmoricola sp.]